MRSNNANTPVKNGQTVTFYSYKGGVGRSMALVNIACLAAKEKKKVLLIDCDLEAPGLHQFFKAPDETPGFIDLVTDFAQWIKTDTENDEEGYNKFMAENAARFICSNVSPFAINTASANLNLPTESLPKTTDIDNSITIDLIKAGRLGSGYSKKLGQLNWMQLYEKAPAFFRTFAIWLETQYDYIFVDARTGLADTSGICTMLMPQKLVMVFVLNNQNINGVADVARQAIEYRFDSNDCRRLDIYPLPSRIENSVNPYLQQWIDNYKAKFEKLFTEKYLLAQCTLSSYFDRSFIQYYAIHAYGENIPALYESITSSNFITYNYNNFYTVLKKNIPAWEVITLEEEQGKINQANEHFRRGLDFYYKKEFDKAIAEYNTAILIKPDFADAFFNMALSKSELNKYEEAIADYQKVILLEGNAADAYDGIGGIKREVGKLDEAVYYFTKAVDAKPDYTEAYNNRGVVKSMQKKYTDAIEDYNRAIAIQPDYVTAVNNKGNAKFALQQYDDAISVYEEALKIGTAQVNSFNGIACVYRKQKKFEQALAYCEKSLFINNSDPVCWVTRAEIFSDMQKEEDFYESIDRALALKADIIKEIADEPEIMNQYLNQPRFIELLKKYNIELTTSIATMK